MVAFLSVVFACYAFSCCNCPPYYLDDFFVEHTFEEDIIPNPALINDPISAATGAMWSAATDIKVKGRMMDIEFTRIYKGDIKEAGFSHKFYLSCPVISWRINKQ